MLTFSPEVLAKWTGGLWSGAPVRPLTGFCIDSRRIAEGDIFVALKTGHRDGHDFVNAAMARGAAAAIVAHPVESSLPTLVVKDPEKSLQACARAHRLNFSGPVIGVTGSCGKTSTKELLKHLLGVDQTLATEGNLNNTLGVPLTLLKLDPRRHRYAVVEAGINRPGEMALLAGMIAPTHAILTMIGLAHSEGLGDVEAIAREKAQLLTAVREDGVVLFPRDCERDASFAAFSARVLTVSAAGAGGRIEYRTRDFRDRTETELVRLRQRQLIRQTDRDRQNRQTDEWSRWEEITLEVSLPALPPVVVRVPPMTEGMIQNTVLALSLAHVLGLPLDLLQERVRAWRPASQRGEVRAHGSQLFYIDCYNANPASMVDSIRFFSERFGSFPKLFVLGSMRELGIHSAEAHFKVGASLRLDAVDRAAFIGEGAEALRAGAASSGNQPGQLLVFPATPDARETVKGFVGAIFLKSSRADALEALLPDPSLGADEEGIAC